MRKILLLFIFVFLYSAADAQVGLVKKNTKDPIQLDYRNPRVFEIAEITVTGAKFLDKNALISISGLKIGDKIKIPGDDISGAIKKLWKNGIIGDVVIYVTKIEGELVYLNIDLKERPRLTRISYDGVTKAQQSELNDQVKLIKGRVLTDVVIKNTELSVKNIISKKDS